MEEDIGSLHYKWEARSGRLLRLAEALLEFRHKGCQGLAIGVLPFDHHEILVAVKEHSIGGRPPALDLVERLAWRLQLVHSRLQLTRTLVGGGLQTVNNGARHRVRSIGDGEFPEIRATPDSRYGGGKQVQARRTAAASDGRRRQPKPTAARHQFDCDMKTVKPISRSGQPPA